MRQSVRAFVEERVNERIEEWWREGRLERGLAREMGAMGLLGATIEGYGCAGMGQVEYGLAMQGAGARGLGGEELCERAERAGDVSDIYVWDGGTKAEWLPQLAKGEKVGCFWADGAGLGE